MKSVAPPNNGMNDLEFTLDLSARLCQRVSPIPDKHALSKPKGLPRAG